MSTLEYFPTLLTIMIIYKQGYPATELEQQYLPNLTFRSQIFEIITKVLHYVTLKLLYVEISVYEGRR